MIEVEVYPRYMAHQLRTQLNATIVGKLTDINKKKETFIIETDPEGNYFIILAKLSVEVILPEQEEVGSFTVGKFYEVRGICKSGKEIELRGYTCFGSDFGTIFSHIDLGSYNQMLQLATKEFKSIFYP